MAGAVVADTLGYQMTVRTKAASGAIDGPTASVAPEMLSPGGHDDPCAVQTVLVVDDDASVRDYLTQVLAGAGFAVDTAVDATSALDAIGRKRPDVVLLEVQLPGMSGFDLCRRIRMNRRTRLTPVVLVTDLADRATRVEGIDAGAVDFVAGECGECPHPVLPPRAREERDAAGLFVLFEHVNQASQLRCVETIHDGLGCGSGLLCLSRGGRTEANG
jgi:PleD family two-component response regulator